MKKKKKTGLDYVKAYNKKISKTKSTLTYVPIDIEAYMELSPAERGQITKAVKKFDLRSERKVSGSNVSVNSRDLLKTLEKISNKKITQFNKQYQDIKLKSQGQEVPEQAAELYKSEAPLTTNINVKKLKPKEILKKGESFQRHFKKDFYDESLKRMQENYYLTLDYLLTMTYSEGDNEGLIKYIRDLPPDKFYELYLENIDMHIVFDDSPTTRKKTQIELPMPDGEALYQAVAVASGYAQKLKNDIKNDVKEVLSAGGYNYNKIIKDLYNLPDTSFIENINDFEIDFDSPENTYNKLIEAINNATEKDKG